MKNYLLPAIALFAAHGISAQIDNGNFDHWSESLTFAHPVMETETMSSNSETFFTEGLTGVFPVEGNEGKAMRLESIESNGEIFPAFFITGQIPQQEGEGLFFNGGVPVTDENITGITVDLRHNISGESPGFVLVQFKANGTPVGEGNMGPGTMMVPLEGEADWHTLTVEFENGFETAPDQCVFAVATADLMTEDGNFPAGSFVEVESVKFLNSAQEFPGGDFEVWADEEPMISPQGVLVDVQPFEPLYARTQDAFEGMYALALKSVTGEDWANTGTAVFAQGDLQNPVPYIAVEPTHTSVSFAYKYEAENDLAGAQIKYFSQAENGTFEEIFVREFTLTPTDDYTVITHDFEQESDEVFETHRAAGEITHMTVTFNSSIWTEGSTPQNGSVLKVDAVALNGSSLRSSFVNVAAPTLIAHPNPTTHRVQFKMDVPRTGFFRVFNAVGVQLDVKQFANTSHIWYDLTNLRSGVYLFRFQHEGGLDAVRVVKQ